jgi:nucleoside-diphosphate-sugar epimerase
VEALLAEGGEVRVLDDLSTGRRDNLPTRADGLEFVEGSIRRSDLLGAALEGVETVFHLAGLVAVPESLETPQRSIEFNDLAVFDLYQTALERGVRRVVFSSSSAVYGDLEAPHHEDLCPRPTTPYAIHKLLGEHYGLYFSEYKGLESVYLRYFNVYGPRQRPDSPYSGVISLFLDRLRRGEPGLIFDDGAQTRDFIFVQDVARANLAAARKPGVSGQSFNIGSGQSISIGALYQILAGLANRPDLAPSFAPARAGDVRHSTGLVAKAAQWLDFQTETSLADGLARTWAWFLASGGH